MGEGDKEESQPTDEPRLRPEFFQCDGSALCSNVLKYKDTKEYQTVNGKGDLLKIKRAVVTWEKGKLEFNKQHEFHIIRSK